MINYQSRRESLSKYNAQKLKSIEDVDLLNQSRIVDQKTNSRINNRLKTNHLVTKWFDQIETMYDLLMHSVENYGDLPFLGSRNRSETGDFADYKWETYQEIYERSVNFGSGLKNCCGLSPGGDNRDFVGIFSVNNSEWVISEKACTIFEYTLVPLYNTLGDQALRFIVGQTEMKVVVIEGFKLLNDFYQDVLNHADYTRKTVESIVVINNNIDSADEKFKSLRSLIENLGVKIHAFSKIENAGKTNPVIHVNKSTGNDVAMINYTSGTTGNPKGVEIMHKSIIAAATSIQFGQQASPETCWYSYLPLPHIYERVIQAQSMMFGEKIGFFSSLKNMIEDLKLLKPTRFGGVPRVWNRFYDKIMIAKNNVDGFEHALSEKVKMVENGLITKNSEFDKYFMNFRNLLGGRVEVASIGAAPVSAEVLNVLRAVFGIRLREGYGQTECLIATSSSPCDHSGSIGPPGIYNEIRLIDVPEMNYFGDKGQCA